MTNDIGNNNNENTNNNGMLIGAEILRLNTSSLAYLVFHTYSLDEKSRTLL